jgi:hypothetical protein
MLEPTLCSEPQGQGEMLQRDDRRQLMATTCGQHPPIMEKYRIGKQSLNRFDPCPFDAETVGVEA